MRIFLSFRKKIKSLEDEQLILLFSRGKDNRIIDEIYYRYSHLVLGTCMKYLKNKMDAEDLTLAIFSQLSEKLIKNEVKQFKSWFYTLTKNECLMQLRKRKPSQIELYENKSLQEEDSLLDDTVELEAQLAQLKSALTMLKTSQKQCLELFYFHKKSYDEIVKITGLSPIQVKSNIQNGKRSLRIMITKNKLS